MNIKTQLSQLKANSGNISDEEISKFTGIDLQQIQELDNGSAKAIAFDTLEALCDLFQCTPNDLLVLEREEIEIDTTPPSAEELRKASEIINKAISIAEAMPPRPAEEILADFQAVRARVGAEIANFERGDITPKDEQGC